MPVIAEGDYAASLGGGGVEIGLYNSGRGLITSNRGAHPKITAPPNWFPRGVVRLGRMSREGADGYFRFYFMFNPTSIDVGYSVDPTVYQPGIDLPKSFTENPAMQGNSTVSFTLMVDRVNEMMDDPNFAGVTDDRQVLEAMFGGLDSEIGRISSMPVDVYFGGKEAWKFRGFPTSINLSLDHFSQKMVPMRMIATISMQRVTSAYGTSNADVTWTPNAGNGARVATDNVGAGLGQGGLIP